MTILHYVGRALAWAILGAVALTVVAVTIAFKTMSAFSHGSSFGGTYYRRY